LDSNIDPTPLRPRYSGNVRTVAIALCIVAAPLSAAAPTFYRDVLPILQNRCQECHRSGEIAPMPLVTYRDTRPWARAIQDAVRRRVMPPWFADPCCGKFSNDRSLSAAEIDTLAKWAETGAEAGNETDAPPPRVWPEGGNLASPDAILEMPRPFEIPAKGAVAYQRFVIPTGFDGDRWVQGVEVRPKAPSVVHHVVVYIREPGETWLQGPTKADMLAVYAPGSSPQVWPEGMAKLIPKGSDLVIELHYTPNGHAVEDQTKVAMVFAKTPPAKRVISLQMYPDHLDIPAGDDDVRVTVWGTLPNDALLLGFFPHMHLRGKAFEYDRILPGGRPDVMLRVSHYNFHWQLFYRLAQPISLRKGTRLVWTAWYDNSANNPLNPDPTVDVHWGEQSWDEMMVGFFDVAVDPSVDRKSFFIRK
jgi:hypothetical protein